ncbi:SapC family protein [Altericroceibacterium endophyticum]|uniref:Multidrug transporter n=1 Tax=Altericroceibacterium endophyticum TaxID=1808508 RepID=A0A6I4SZX5_9SPHN|nr:SapC family protein [Altericroceibacterium endophyticum]MXO64374.1 multidrug transporter [Altericroceibacterium endophyticum]
MASAPQANLPLFYKDLTPLNSRDHANWRSKSVDKAPWIAQQHAIPLTTDEFAQAQRHFPIVFSSGDNPVPLALLGLHEGVNVFFKDDGEALEDAYVPAYARRYPFLLAKLDAKNDNMSLCFDPSSDLIGDFKEGRELFKESEPTEHTQEVLQFCQRFEEAGRRTQNFVEELKKADLLMDGEVAIQRGDDSDKPFIYRGFQMINQDKLREVRGDLLRTWNQSGMLPLIFAHLFSLDRMRVIFAKQVEQGKGPAAEAAKSDAKKKN